MRPKLDKVHPVNVDLKSVFPFVKNLAAKSLKPDPTNEPQSSKLRQKQLDQLARAVLLDVHFSVEESYPTPHIHEQKTTSNYV